MWWWSSLGGDFELTHPRLPELVEGLPFTGHLSIQKGQGFDKLSQAGPKTASLYAAASAISIATSFPGCVVIA